MVYSMLMAATDSGDPASFKESDLFKRCRAAGIIPASEEDLKGRVHEQELSDPPFQHAAPPVPADTTHLTLDLTIGGMWCPACAWVIEEGLRQSKGVYHPQCRFVVDRLRCTYDPTLTSPIEIQKKIDSLGYTLQEVESRRRSGRRPSGLIRLLISGFLSMNVMMLSLALYSGFFSELSPEAVRSISWPIFIMATMVFIYGGRPIFRKAVAGIKAGASGMEALITMGSASAYGYSLYHFFNHSIHLYFDTASMLIVLTLLGKQIEERAKNRVREDLDGLFALAPRKVRLVTKEFPRGRFADIAQLEAGHRFRVEKDEIIAADGWVVSGRATVDESALTGEARPVEVGPGSHLKSGACLMTGSVVAEASAVGETSTLGQMVAVIQESLYRKSPIETRTDKILRIFTPFILLLALATGGVCLWKGYLLETVVTRMVTVMVIACPCALGIAVPMARVAGIGLAGRRGILVRESEAFEQAGRIDTVVFDKTGTLTTGQWHLTRVESCRGMDPAVILRLAAGLEKNSDHLVAREIRRKSGQEGLEPFPIEDPEVHPNGVSGQYRDRRYLLGSSRFAGIDDRPRTGEKCRAQTVSQESSRIYLKRDQALLGILHFGDQLRPSARETIDFFRKRGKSVSLVTGDGSASAQFVAHQLGLEEFRCGLLPLEKAAYVDRLRSGGRRVAMLGDGINDAPALSRADLSAALASANPLTDQTAQITLMKADPGQLIDFIHLSRLVTRKIHQNLWCALIYNIFSLPVAMGGWISPLVAVTAMLASSLTVTLNTLSLVRTRVK